MVKCILGMCACLCLVAGTLQAQNEDRQLVDAARKTLKAYDKAIISLSAVVKIEAGGFGGGEQERKTQCVGAIIDPCGLAVTSLTNLNPQSLLRLRFSRAGGGTAPKSIARFKRSSIGWPTARSCLPA